MKNFSKALSYSFLLLRYRPRTEVEIYKRLKNKKYPWAIIKDVVEVLKNYNYINDQDFIKSYISSSLEKGWGPVRVNVNLKKIGISEKLREKAVRKIEAKSNKLIKNLIDQKKYSLNKNQPNLDKNKKQKKIIKFLANKGFYYRDIFTHLANKKNEN